ncbi:alpha/beta hydrolase [Stenotrophomonas sp. SY1]|uniref:alpha/beta hydrolase n=1 Tax=Stenotrophomonas sp. SY1 TaxID=477235 RepID=UPI001E4D2B36|nr:alpha/beta hydrolase [Stenotrophomonas sp. SY1]MCD9085433.1 alpha/beta hydrolase [Stenotrophomonas sp. SY1]
MSRKTQTLLAVAVIAGIVGYRLTRPAADAAPTTVAAASAAETVAAKPQLLGSLKFQPCSLSSASSRTSLEAHCTTFEVPEDRANPQGRKIALNIAWLAPEKEGDVQADPLFFLAGGPGQSAVDSFQQMGPAFAEVRKHRNVILVDQRGTGKSNLLACTAGQGDDMSVAAIRAETTRCAQTLAAKADLRHYTTTDAVADLDAVRQAIGAQQLNLYGVSYGTRVAQQYAMRHPQHTRSIVLDSVVPNDLQLGNIVARNLDEALALQFAQCTRTASCKDKLGDPRAELDALLVKLRAQPVTVRYRDATSGEQREDVLRAETVAGLVRMYAYMPAAASLLPKLIHEAGQGRYENLMALAQMLQGDMQDSMAMGMQLSVICSEDRKQITSQQGDENTVLGNQMAQSLAAMCEVWPKGTAPADFHQPLATPVPALVLAGEFDPVTPPRYGEEVVKHLPNGRLFVLRGQGHAVLGAGCMPKLFAQFVEKADAKPLDGACLDKLNYVPPFTSFNGWEP